MPSEFDLKTFVETRLAQLDISAANAERRGGSRGARRYGFGRFI